MRLRSIAAGAATLLPLFFGVPSASATFHLMQVREVYPGTAASPASEYVELQMWAAGQELVGGHAVRTYAADGTLVARDELPANVASGINQATVLLATPEAEAQFPGIHADATLAPGGQIDPSGGAVCWEAIDCVSWGSFSGSVGSPTGTPAAPIPDGMALRRTIEPGCSTLLEQGDDRDNSALDFFAAAPNPRPNSVAPTEVPCPSGKPPIGTPERAPQTTIARRPAKRTHDRTPTFAFRSNRPGSTFECALDRHGFRRCRSPLTTKPLSFGAHTFRVRARNVQSVADPSPATYAFRVLRKS